MKKYFLLCVTHGQSTRMLTDEEAIDLHAMLKGFYRVWSNGAVPKVEVEPLDQGDIDSLIFVLGYAAAKASDTPDAPDEIILKAVDRVSPKFGVTHRFTATANDGN